VSRCGFTVLVVGSALLLTAPALSAVRDNPPGPAQQAAQACQSQGLAPDSDAYKQCVAKLIGGAQVPQSVIDACKAKGLTPGSPSFNACVSAAMAGAAHPGPTSPSLTPTQQAAIATCKGKGLTENTDAYRQCIAEQTVTGPALTPAQQFKQCVNAYAQDPHNNTSLTPKQLAAFDTCKAKGTSGSALKDCLEKQLTTVTKAVRPEAEAEISAAMAACNAKHLKQADFRDCLKTRLNQ
jgi:hypothetical protein